MRIVFVRHGHPNYENDCLTPLGKQHAEAAAERLLEENIQRIYSSTCGRALETAAPLAEKTGLEVIRCDFMREITWGSKNGRELFHDGHPWDTADRMIAEGESLVEPDWAAREPFRDNAVVDCVEGIAKATDEWLAGLGYVRRGQYYLVEEPRWDTVAAFGHGGASTAILSHLLNLPFPFVCSHMGPDYTGITILNLSGERGTLVSPRVVMLNDAKHIRHLRIQNVYNR